jgi:hypothetical protein
VRDRERSIVRVAVWWAMQLAFYPTKVSVASVTNTITSFGTHLGVSLFGTFLQWSCVSRVLVYLKCTPCMGLEETIFLYSLRFF